MKVITLKQPWASLIFYGKDIENRTWKTNHRGPILIHAGKTWDDKAVTTAPNHKMENGFISMSTRKSAIIGIVDIIDCMKGHKSKWAESNMWNWVLYNPRKIIPVEGVKGKQGLWNYDLHYSVVPINPYENMKVNYEM